MDVEPLNAGLDAECRVDGVRLGFAARDGGLGGGLVGSRRSPSVRTDVPPLSPFIRTAAFLAES